MSVYFVFGETAPCRMTGRDLILRSSYTGLYPQIVVLVVARRPFVPAVLPNVGAVGHPCKGYSQVIQVLVSPLCGAGGACEGVGLTIKVD